MSECIYHPGVPVYKRCNVCGAGICMNCSFTDEVGSRVVAFSSVDQAREVDYATFCPNCMVLRGQEKGYDNPGKWKSDKGSIGILLLGIVTIPFGIGLIIIPIALVMYACTRNEHLKKHNLYLKAWNISSGVTGTSIGVPAPGPVTATRAPSPSVVIAPTPTPTPVPESTPVSAATSEKFAGMTNDDIYTRAAFAWQREDKAEALNCLQFLATHYPDYCKGRYLLANVLGLEKRYEEALGHYDAILSIEPNNPEYIGQRGMLLCGMGRMDEGVVEIKRAVQMDPSIDRFQKFLRNVGY